MVDRVLTHTSLQPEDICRSTATRNADTIQPALSHLGALCAVASGSGQPERSWTRAQSANKDCVYDQDHGGQ
jgi:hypothetical protein